MAPYTLVSRILLSLAGCAAAALASAAYPPVPAGVKFDAVLALPAAQPSAVLRYGAAPEQLAELWLPEASSAAPLLVFIHGGCWLNRYGVDHSRPLATALRERGFAVLALEYRRIGDAGGGWPGSYADIRAGLELLARQLPDGIDPQRVALAGHSAGGHLALLLASELRDAPLPGLNLRGVLGLAPITDISEYATGTGSCNKAAVDFMGAAPGAAPAAYAAANPAGRATHPGTVILLGRDDPIIPYRLPELAAHTLVAEPAGHFDWIHPGTPAWQRFVLELERLLP